MCDIIDNTPEKSKVSCSACSRKATVFGAIRRPETSDECDAVHTVPLCEIHGREWTDRSLVSHRIDMLNARAEGLEDSMGMMGRMHLDTAEDLTPAGHDMDYDMILELVKKLRSLKADMDGTARVQKEVETAIAVYKKHLECFEGGFDW